MGPEFDPVETAENSVQDEMPQLVKPQSGKEDFYNRHTAVASAEARQVEAKLQP